MKGYLSLYRWADSLVECGPKGEVGVGMIDEIRRKLRGAYLNGFQDGQAHKKGSRLQTRRGVRGRRFRG